MMKQDNYCYYENTKVGVDLEHIRDNKIKLIKNKEYKVVFNMDLYTGSILNIRLFNIDTGAKRPINCTGTTSRGIEAYVCHVDFKKGMFEDMYDMITVAKVIAKDKWYCDCGINHRGE